MSDAPIQPTRSDWELAIGRFLLNFAQLDSFVLLFLRNNLEPSEFVKIRGLTFKARLARMEQHFSGTDCPMEKQEEFSGLCKRLDPVRILRNHIAHGYMLARLVAETKTRVISISLPRDLDLEFSPETKHLEFGELRDSLIEVSALCRAFEEYSGLTPGWSPSFASALAASDDEYES